MPVVTVTGVSGKSGVAFLKRLHLSPPNGYKFRFIFRNKVAAESLLHLLGNIPHEIVYADFNNDNDLEKLFTSDCSEPTDTLLHIAGIHFSRKIVTSALEHGVTRLILVHTTGIYSKYKKASEGYIDTECVIRKMIKDRSADGNTIYLSILRPTMIYGDLQDGNMSIFIKMVHKLRLFPLIGSGDHSIQPVWCNDLGNAYYDILVNPEITNNKDYILSGDAPLQLRQMFMIIAEHLHVNNTFISVPFWIAYSGAWIIYVLSLAKIDLREKVQRMVENRAFSHDEATKDFGYSPTPFEIGISEEISMYLESNNNL